MFSPMPALNTLNVAPAAPAQAAQAPSTQGPDDEGRAFARQLHSAQQTGADTATRPGTATPHARAAAARTAPKAPRVADEPMERNTGAAAPAQGQARSSAPAAEPAGLTGADPAATTDSELEQEGSDTQGPADLGALLAQLHSQGPRPGAAHTAAAKAEGAKARDLPAEATNGRTKAEASGRDLTAGHAALPTPAAGAEKTHARAAEGSGRGPVAAFQEQLSLAQRGPSEAPVQEKVLAPEAPSNALPLAAPGSSATLRSETPPVQQTLKAHLNSPEFAPQLGAQISTFVRDGVEHAQLHLNPAEMGPVTVQIQLDGQGARVHLMADQAPTRQALEQAMPQLAGSLREAGLTLTGGGVFQQPRQAGGEAGQGKPGRGTPAGVAAVGAAGAEGAASPVSGSVAAPRRRGVVDLVA